MQKSTTDYENVVRQMSGQKPIPAAPPAGMIGGFLSTDSPPAHKAIKQAAEAVARTAALEPTFPDKTKKKHEKERVEEHLSSPPTDALTRIGLFRGGVGVPTIFTSYERKLTAIVDGIDKVNRNLTAD
jgi:hypothetical protein